MADIIWQRTFSRVVEEHGIPDDWSLFQDAELNKEEGWLCYDQTTFGSFRCSNCRRFWHSAEISIMFLLQQNRWNRSGRVRMRIFRQQCSQCEYPIMETPNIQIKNVERVVRNLANKICRTYYGAPTGTEDLKSIANVKADGPHDKENCEACQGGICEEKGFGSAGVIVGAVAVAAALGIGALFAFSQEKKQKK
ncbi:receptor-transporting protein 4-like [Spea bombifrons]|uniref:receptor-transporting protein 4-like n=1 Tax=Spea bombifrons TaxID=233779 RepID=UPI00234A3DDC|nr:receptor-transporting protein 4-like [Spea bombifrons]